MTLRFVCAAVLIGFTAILLRDRKEIVLEHRPLESFPRQLGAWTGSDREIDKETRDTLGAGDFLLRDYSPQVDTEPEVNLFIAYFPSQRSGDTIHSPRNCLPGNGWLPAENERITLSVPGHAPFPANRYVVTKGDSRLLVLYWYWAHDRGVASEYWAKYYLVADAIRMNRSDGALVRIVISMVPGETSEAAQQRVMPFCSRVVALLDDYIPR
ncbi:MAG: exosortase C-terminal domain/associated protein EpsI [Candidatus Sulfotelmatobacter sp.]